MVEGRKKTEESARATREHVAVAWDDGKVEALIGRMRARERRRTVTRASLAAAAIVAVAVTYTLWPTTPTREPGIVRADADDGVIRLADGSTVTPLDDASEIVVVRETDDEIVLDIVRGGGHFDVVRNLPRAFRVQAGQVEVSVVGTVFEVRRDADHADVRVLEGRVRVTWPPDGEAEVGAGEEGRFPREAIIEEPPSEASVRAPSEPSAAIEPAIQPANEAPRRRVARAEPVAPAAWVALADAGDYDHAVALLEHDARAIESSNANTLLLASDTLRLTGHPDRALAFLDRAAEVTDGEARAPLVAFTRGRLLLTGLSRFREAATAFARARELAPEGSLAMDALGREVEALWRAGDTDAARARAEEYVARYPNGLRVDAVRRWGGLTSE